MFVKLLGSSLIIFTGAYIGFSLAKRCSDRPANLRQILSCIVALKSYMNYASMPLAESLVQCSSGTGKNVSGFFLTVAGLLKKNYLMQPQEAIEKTLVDYRYKLALVQEDCDLLILLGCNLGHMDKTEQDKYLLMVEQRLEILEREATVDRDKNCKMYRYLGVCGSLMVVLLLI